MLRWSIYVQAFYALSLQIFNGCHKGVSSKQSIRRDVARQVLRSRVVSEHLSSGHVGLQARVIHIWEAQLTRWSHAAPGHSHQLFRSDHIRVASGQIILENRHVISIELGPHELCEGHEGLVDGACDDHFRNEGSIWVIRTQVHTLGKVDGIKRTVALEKF